MLRHVLTTTTTYATRDRAVRKLENVLRHFEADRPVPYFVAVNEEGRFAPVVQATGHPQQANLIALVHHGITVV